tara:strand:- start:247 stop:645 length:399 start_codon:yes stop_codon:yes gene_type:complete
MGRLKGGRNNNHYKYILRCYGGPEEYYTSYPHIYTVHPTLTKSAITNIIFYPERSVNNKKYSIIKLAKPLPVFEKKTIIDLAGNTVNMLVNINYNDLKPRGYVPPSAPPCPPAHCGGQVAHAHVEPVALSHT